MSHHRLRKLVIGGACAAGALTIGVGLAPTAAWAHVGAAATAEPGGATKVTFTFTHGCESAPTTSLRVQLPAGTSGVTAEDPAGWTSTVTASELQWTGGSIPNGQRGSFSAVMTVPGQAGETVFLPTIQGCPGGAEEAWIAKTPDPEATDAAPRIVLSSTSAATTTTAAADDHDHDAPTSGAPATTAPATTATPVTTASTGTTAGNATGTLAPATGAAASTSSNTALILGAVAVVLVLLGIGGYVLSTRSSASEG